MATKYFFLILLKQHNFPIFLVTNANENNLDNFTVDGVCAEQIRDRRFLNAHHSTCRRETSIIYLFEISK